MKGRGEQMFKVQDGGDIEHQCKTDDGEKCNDTWVGNKDAGSRMCYASKQEKSRNGERRKLRIEMDIGQTGTRAIFIYDAKLRIAHKLSTTHRYTRRSERIQRRHRGQRE